MVCERGTMFGYSDLIVDPRNFVLMRDAGCPVTADVTHALQQPVSHPRSFLHYNPSRVDWIEVFLVSIVMSGAI